MNDELNFFQIATDLKLHVSGTIQDLPESPGAYMLFSVTGNFIYCGQAVDLRRRVQEHFSPQEENIFVKLLACYFIWRQTQTVEDAASLEGELYDLSIEITGAPPLANRIAPPESKSGARKALLERLMKLADKLNRT